MFRALSSTLACTYYMSMILVYSVGNRLARIFNVTFKAEVWLQMYPHMFV